MDRNGGAILQPPLTIDENVTWEKLHVWKYISQRGIQKGCLCRLESIPNAICFSDQNAPFDDKSKRQMTEISDWAMSQNYNIFLKDTV